MYGSPTVDKDTWQLLILFVPQVFYAYTYTTAGWLGVQSIALIAAPQLVTTSLLEETRTPTRKFKDRSDPKVINPNG